MLALPPTIAPIKKGGPRGPPFLQMTGRLTYQMSLCIRQDHFPDNPSMRPACRLDAKPRVGLAQPKTGSLNRSFGLAIQALLDLIGKDKLTIEAGIRQRTPFAIFYTTTNYAETPSV